MTIHAANTNTHSWHCAACGTCKAGYPSQSAARRAETRHADSARHATAGANGGAR